MGAVSACCCGVFVNAGLCSACNAVCCCCGWLLLLGSPSAMGALGVVSCLLGVRDRLLLLAIGGVGPYVAFGP